MKTFSVGLNRAQATKLADFCKANAVKKFFFAKDHGAYFGVTKGSEAAGNFESCIVYMRGCDPNKDEHFYEVSRERFGGDDFGEHFDTKLLNEFVASGYKRINFKFNKCSISVKYSA